jgi:phosphoserine aminotransferase
MVIAANSLQFEAVQQSVVKENLPPILTYWISSSFNMICPSLKSFLRSRMSVVFEVRLRCVRGELDKLILLYKLKKEFNFDNERKQFRAVSRLVLAP